MQVSSKLTRPGYILATSSGMYGGMIKHNLIKSLSPAFQMTAVNFVDMYSLKDTLTKYTEHTKKLPLEYFNLIRPAEVPGVEQQAEQPPLTILTPFAFSEQSKNPAVSGFQKSHQEYQLNGRTKVTINDSYLPLIQLLKPTYAVSIIE